MHLWEEFSFWRKCVAHVCFSWELGWMCMYFQIWCFDIWGCNWEDKVVELLFKMPWEISLFLLIHISKTRWDLLKLVLIKSSEAFSNCWQFQFSDFNIIIFFNFMLELVDWEFTYQLVHHFLELELRCSRNLSKCIINSDQDFQHNKLFVLEISFTIIMCFYLLCKK